MFHTHTIYNQQNANTQFNGNIKQTRLVYNQIWAALYYYFSLR